MYNSSNIGWDSYQDAILREYYPIGGGKLCVEKGLDKKLSTIRMRAKKLGISSKYTVWSEEELAILYAMYKDNTVTAISSKLKGRSGNAIKKKLEELGLERIPKWSEDEIEILVKYFPIGGSKLVKAKGVSKDTAVITSKASSMGLRLNESRVSWTDEEVGILVKYYKTEGMEVVKRLKGKDRSNIVSKLNSINTYYREKYAHWSISDRYLLRCNKDKEIGELVKLLPLRSKEEIEDLATYYSWKYASRAVHSSWSDEDIEFLIKNYDKYSASELQAMGLNKTKSAIYNKISILGLSTRDGYKTWTDDELSILSDNFNIKPLDELCDLLPDKTRGAIKCKASILGLSRDSMPNWDDKELSIIKTYYPKYGVKGVVNEMKKQLGVAKRTKTAIYKKAISLGLKRQ